MPHPWAAVGPQGPPGPPGPVASGAEQTIRFAIGTDATTDSDTEIDDTAYVTECWVEVTTPYTGGTTISVGQAGSTSLFQSTSGNSPIATGKYITNQDTQAIATGPIRVTIGGSPAAGAGFVMVKYSTPDT